MRVGEINLNLCRDTVSVIVSFIPPIHLTCINIYIYIDNRDQLLFIAVSNFCIVKSNQSL